MAQEQITPKIDFTTELAGLFNLQGKVAYIPGGYGGIGEALAWGLAMHGARVVISGRSSDKAQALAKNLMNEGYEARACELDAHSVAQIRESVDFVIEQYGAIDILINCVGMQREEAILDVSEEAFDELYTVNLKAAMFLAQAAAKYQIKADKGGKHIHLLSVRSQLGLRDRGYSAYCSTKGALVMLVKQHAMELASYRINVNGIAPTFVFTEMIRHVVEDDAFRNALVNRIPLGHIADPKDIVGPSLFFASAASDFVTGQTLYVDGGITASQ
jgi:NAD(P)-dependent dehydrogenase (short-subunit alcohol dehydrogenase family)